MERKKLTVAVPTPRKRLEQALPDPNLVYQTHLRRNVRMDQAEDLKDALAGLEMELTRTFKLHLRNEIKMALIRLREAYEKVSGQTLPYKPYWAEEGSYQPRMQAE